MIGYLLQGDKFDFDKFMLTATGEEHVKLTKYTIENGADPHQGLIYAANCARLGVVKYLIEECNANVHIMDDMPFRQAVMQENIEKGANIHANNNEVYNWDMQKGNPEIVRLLTQV